MTQSVTFTFCQALASMTHSVTSYILAGPGKFSPENSNLSLAHLSLAHFCQVKESSNLTNAIFGLTFLKKQAFFPTQFYIHGEQPCLPELPPLVPSMTMGNLSVAYLSRIPYTLELPTLPP